MNRIFLQILLTLFAVESFSQDIFSPAKIIKANGDTINGYLSNLYSAREIKFKETEDSKAKILKPNELLGYIYQGNLYFSKSVSFTSYRSLQTIIGSFSGPTQNFLMIDNDKKRMTDSLFLAKIVTGKMNLYKATHSDNTKYLFIENTNKISEVPPAYFSFEIDSLLRAHYGNTPLNMVSTIKGTYYEQRSYLDTLSTFFRDVNKSYTFKSFKYSEQNIIDAVNDFNISENTKDSGLIHKKMKRKIYFGANLHALGFSRIVSFERVPNIKFDSYEIYALFPLYGMSRNTFIKVGFNSFSNTLFLLNGGMRYSIMQGAVRPYAGFLGNLRLPSKNDDLPTLISTSIEAGVTIPIKKVNVNIGAYMTPLMERKIHGYKFISYSLGVFF
jgi:hypothetical protein